MASRIGVAFIPKAFSNLIESTIKGLSNSYIISTVSFASGMKRPPIAIISLPILEVISKMVDWGSNPSWERANGSYRRTMGSGRTVIAQTSETSGWQRQTKSGRPGDLEWDLVDHANGSTVARSARAISTLPNLPSTFPRMGSFRYVGSHPQEISPGCPGARWLGV